MAPSDEARHGDVVRFAAFEVDLRSGELRKSGVKVRLQDQPFRVLRVLLDHAGEVVTREELQRQIWPSDTFVDFDRGLNNAVKRLREALGDEADTPRYIETVPKRGYRFVGALRPDTPSQAGAEQSVAPPSRPGSRTTWKRAVAVALAALALAAVLWFLFRTAPPPRIQSLAVIPLANLSSDPAQEYLSDGITDALITEVSRIRSIRVISRTSMMHYKKTTLTLPQIAQELNVDGIIEGTVQRSGDRVQITAQLIHAASDKHLWAETYERDLTDVFGLQRDVATEIARQVQAEISSGGQPAQRQVNIQALESYLQGKQILERIGQGFGDLERRKAEPLFEAAVRFDPDFADAYRGLAQCHCYQLLPVTSDDRAIIARANAKAAALDPRSSSVDPCRLAEDKSEAGDVPGAEQGYRQCIEINPNSAIAHHRLGDLLDSQGRLDEGWKEHLAGQRIDPRPMAPDLYLPTALILRRKYDEAIEVLKLVTESEPNEGQTHLLLAACYKAKGMQRDVIEELGKASASYGRPNVLPLVRKAFAESGYSAALREYTRLFEEAQARDEVYAPTYVADVYLNDLNDRPRAFHSLEAAYNERNTRRSPCSLDYDPEGMLESLKAKPEISSDPQFQQLLKRVGLVR